MSQEQTKNFQPCNVVKNTCSKNRERATQRSHQPDQASQNIILIFNSRLHSRNRLSSRNSRNLRGTGSASNVRCIADFVRQCSHELVDCYQVFENQFARVDSNLQQEERREETTIRVTSSDNVVGQRVEAGSSRNHSLGCKTSG